ncbi:hypothetical protein dqs_1929 [Azoarcus olearius]|uniref:hypothetical protein n=1 Tax=Azoarcus sp. (strain BH72) TaxID=418699 RepID=UPI00080633B8|nr:hypothetical protein [Azoarcus olearius]ANQ84967.1 hypothetical protein dqs_1929 [Azoarcus olearius]
MKFDFVYLHAIGSVGLLVGFLVATTLVQQRSSERIKDILDKVSEPVKETSSYKSADRYFKRREVVNLFTNKAHWIPVWFLILVVFSCSMVSYFGAGLIYADSQLVRSYVLGGAYASVDGGDVATNALRNYQSGTVFIGTMAFLGAYCWVIAQLMNRMNNDDMSPVSCYFLSVRIITACIVAGIARHIVEGASGLFTTAEGDVQGALNAAPVRLAILGFLIGWNPTLWINELLVKLADLVRSKIPSQSWPRKENLPSNLSLLMIQGMVVDKIDRLMELNIDNCQKLAHDNPMVIWVKTSFSLNLIIDWIAQAKLCLLFEDDKLAALRRNGVRDIFQYVQSISDSAGLAAIENILQVPAALIEGHRRSIPMGQSYQELAELRRALAVDDCSVCGLDLTVYQRGLVLPADIQS